MSETTEVLIVGAGVAGLSLALALCRAGRQVTLLDAGPKPCPDDQHTGRSPAVVALNAASLALLHELDAWHSDLDSVWFRRMRVWEGETRLSFDPDLLNLPALGAIVSLSSLRQQLLQALHAQDRCQVRFGQQAVGLQLHADYARLRLADDTLWQADLLVAADGGRSPLRGMAGLACTQHAWQEKAIVALVRGDLGHQDTAWQGFLPSGPLGLLPWKDQYSALIWSLPQDEADAVLAMTETAFAERLTSMSQSCIGTIDAVTCRHAFPLLHQHAERYIAPRFTLLGDAAHVMHPFAGLGINMGLRDVAVLAELMVKDTHRRTGSATLMRRFERWQRSENAVQLAALKQLRLLFARQYGPWSRIRRMGMGALDQLPAVKRQLIRHALGDYGMRPSSMQHLAFRMQQM